MRRFAARAKPQFLIDPLREFRVDIEELSSPAALNFFERHIWLELWRAPSVEAVEGEGFETRFYGPLHAHALLTDPREPLLNVVLGAGAAVMAMHLQVAQLAFSTTKATARGLQPGELLNELLRLQFGTA